MDITYLGHASFRFRGKSASLVTDPFDDSSIGLKYPKRIEATVVTVSHDHADHNAVGNIKGDPFVITGPGEYEVGGIGIIGAKTYHDEEKGAQRGINVIYRVEVDGVSIVHLGDLGHELSDETLEEIDGVDVLCIPVGGHYTIDAKTAVRVVNEISPTYVIPMHYKRPGLKEDVFKDVTDVSVFFEELKLDMPTPEPKLVLKRELMPTERQVVLLESKA